MSKAILDIPPNFDWDDKTNNLLLNMSGGLLPKDLQEDEIALLEQRFGKDWFTALGYYEPRYERPKSLQINTLPLWKPRCYENKCRVYSEKDKIKPGHGPCCTCQVCGYPYDECICKFFEEPCLSCQHKGKGV